MDATRLVQARSSLRQASTLLEVVCDECIRPGVRRCERCGVVQARMYLRRAIDALSREVGASAQEAAAEPLAVPAQEAATQ